MNLSHMLNEILGTVLAISFYLNLILAGIEFNKGNYQKANLAISLAILATLLLRRMS